jgi:hypothetical protein
LKPLVENEAPCATEQSLDIVKIRILNVMRVPINGRKYFISRGNPSKNNVINLVKVGVL